MEENYKDIREECSKDYDERVESYGLDSKYHKEIKEATYSGGLKNLSIDYLEGLKAGLTYAILEDTIYSWWDLPCSLNDDLSGIIQMADKAIKEILDAMECHEASEHFEDYMNEPTKKTTPCDYPDNDGKYSCPYDAHGGDDCRNFCGLGVDE